MNPVRLELKLWSQNWNSLNKVFLTLTRSLTNNILADAATNAYLAECSTIAEIKKKLSHLKILVIKQTKVPAVAQCICSIITREASVCALFNDALPAYWLMSQVLKECNIFHFVQPLSNKCCLYII